MSAPKDNRSPDASVLRRIRMILTDVDGVLTDGGIIFGDGEADYKRFDVQDGAGSVFARRSGLLVGIIAGRSSESVSRRAEELKVDELWQGELDKRIPYEKIKEKRGLDDAEIAYLGDDFLDIPILKRVGFAVAVANGRPEVKAIADYVTEARGGHGAFREVAELILKAQGKWEKVLERYDSVEPAESRTKADRVTEAEVR